MDDTPLGFVIEDEYREIKVSGETRIPIGVYKLKIREYMTPLTKKYRAKYSWFKYHIELQDVPNFKYVYLHIGNSTDDTDACQIIGRDASIQNGNFVNKYSTDMFKAFYESVYPALVSGVEVLYEIKGLR